MKSIALFLLLLAPSTLLAKAFVAPLAETTDNLNYPSIEFMSVSEGLDLPLASDPESLPPEAPQAKTMRVVVYRSEIYQSLVVETLTTGMEGCCSKVARRQSIDLEGFAAHFGFRGEISGFSFSGWSSHNSFRFTYQGAPFHATLQSDDRIHIERDMSANNSFKPTPLRGAA